MSTVHAAVESPLQASVHWGLSEDAWQAFVARCPHATFFHTPGWYRACAESLGYRPDPALIRFADGREALVPIATRPQYKGLIRQAFSGIENGYGGLVAPQALSEAEVQAAYALVRKRYPDLIVVGNPHEAFGTLPAGGEREEDATQVVPVLPREAQLKAMSETRQKHTKRALKEPFELVIVEGLVEADADRFFDLYAIHSARWEYQKWRRDRAYFRALCRHAGADLALFLAYRDGQLAGFRLLGLGGPVVMDLYLATDEVHEKRHVGPYLVAEPLAWCHEKGYAAFDFQPSGRLEGVKGYKASFGAATLAHGTVAHVGLLGGALKALRQAATRPRAALTPAT